MIKVESITINEFRGIRDLTLDFGGRNFAICGPNGTGKSGVVDALEFALTGNVSRLSGEGKGEVSLKQHGPHVDKRDDPAKARVVVKFTILSLNRTVTVERSLKDASKPTITPSDPEILEALNQMKAHPEIVLSRRELIRYVLATPGKRAEEVQALLHLDEVEQVRLSLQTIANSCEKQVAPFLAMEKQAHDNLLRALETPDLDQARVLAVVNVQRAILGLPAITELTKTTSLKDGMTVPGPIKAHRIPKAQALADIQATRDLIALISSNPTVTHVAELTADLDDLANDPAVATGIQREKFYAIGLDLTEDEVCPYCDTGWNLNELKVHVQLKIDHLKEVALRRKNVETKIAPLLQIVRNVQIALEVVLDYANRSTPPIAMVATRDYKSKCEAAIERLTAILPLEETIATLSHVPKVPAEVIESIDELEKVINALPEPTKQDAARDWLTIAQERYEVFRDAVRKLKVAEEQARKARQVSDIYTTTSDTVLTGIYTAVQKDFASLYGFINRDDEEKFEAKLTPSMGKLGFNVDFYGRGYFPPGAYHSEGHQDGMGLCLYLALMRHLQGDGFTFAVLDDVLMSVDTGHRREVCALLKNEFPNTQFIMTTHDAIWLRHMKTEKLVDSSGAVQFRNWSIDHGPARWDDRDVWAEIGEHLDKNDVRAAAALLRHFLEYTSAELCHRLRAPVEFRGDAQYQLGELFPAAIKRMRMLLRGAKDAANSWGAKEVIEQLNARENNFGTLATTSRAEEWQINAAVHFNSWDNLGKADFEPVLHSYRELLNGFTCSECNGYLYVSPDRETPETVRCGCGKTNINLRKKDV